MDMQTHQEIADANRLFYQKYPDELTNFQQFTDTPLVQRHISKNIEHCLQLMDFSRSCLESKAVFLDLGTGTGQMIRHLVKHVPQQSIHAIDISEENIRIAKEKFPDVHFLVGDFMMDFDPGCQFDFISLYSVMHHFYDWRNLVRKLDDCLSPGGVIYIDHEPLRGLTSKLINYLMRLKHRKNPDYFTCEYHQFSDPIDPFHVVEQLSSKYQCRIIYNNFGVLVPVMVRTGLDLSLLVPKTLTVDRDYKRVLSHLFCNYGIIAKKL
jgi:SAM-dependent methyltransferase